MKSSVDNPSSNSLPPSLSEQNLTIAINKSGYPLQSLVAHKLKNQFVITEEWGFIDRDTEKHRSLDLFAFKEMDQSLIQGTQTYIRPSVALLIECKKSHNPFIFFQSEVARPIPKFPSLVRIKDNQIDLINFSGPQVGYTVDGSKAYALAELKVIAECPYRCSVFSKFEIKGDKGDKSILSGEEPFNNIVLPLITALLHAEKMYFRNRVESPIRPTLLFSICVLDAPMILIKSPNLMEEPIMAPWVRIIRQESASKADALNSSRTFGIDAVHIDFLDTYINSFIIPSISEFDRRMRVYGAPLRGHARVTDFKNFSYKDWELAM